MGPPCEISALTRRRDQSFLSLPCEHTLEPRRELSPEPNHAGTMIPNSRILRNKCWLIKALRPQYFAIAAQADKDSEAV